MLDLDVIAKCEQLTTWLASYWNLSKNLYGDQKFPYNLAQWWY